MGGAGYGRLTPGRLRKAHARPQLSVQGGWGEGGAEWQPRLLRLTQPPHIRKIFLRKKNEIYQRDSQLEADLRTQILFLASDPNVPGMGKIRH